MSGGKALVSVASWNGFRFGRRMFECTTPGGGKQNGNFMSDVGGEFEDLKVI